MNDSDVTGIRPGPARIRWFAHVALLSVLFLGPVVGAQAQERTTLDRVQEAFARGDARGLLEEAADRIEIVLLGRSMQYSRSQAVYVMDEFFREYPPEQFLLADTSGTDGSRFAASQYWSNRQEDPLQVYIHLRQVNDHWVIREIRVERRRR